MTDDDETDKLCKAERLRVGGYVAPRLRSSTSRRRPIKVVDAEGNVVGFKTLGEVQDKILERHAIEIEVQEDERPKEVPCLRCGKPIPVLRAKGRLPRFCRSKDGGCDRQTTCAAEGCDKRPPGRTAFSPSAMASRGGAAWMCVEHALTPEQRSERARKGAAALTPEQRSERARKASAAAAAALTPEQRSENAREGAAALTPEQRSERARKANAARTLEQRRAYGRMAQAALTPEQRSENARKAGKASSAARRAKGTA